MNHSTPPALSPVDYSVISEALLSAAREMGAKLYRSAYSSIVRDGKDASTGLMDAAGSAVAQSDELIPILVGSLSLTLRQCLKRYPVETLEPGDFYITNHPYEGAQHLQDIFIFVPIFGEAGVIGFSAAVAHHIDIGGGSPGLNSNATDIYAEGFILPPLKYNYDRDWNGPLRTLLGANFRMPEQTLGDIEAQFAACRIGIARVEALSRKYGEAKVTKAMAEMIDYVERRLRSAITAIPDGVYVGEDAVDDDGRSETPLTVRATVTVDGDRMSVDFTGTCPQVKTHLNAPFASCVSSTLACIKAVLTGEDVPFNEGANRAVTITAPKGCLVNPLPPAPVRARMEATYRVYDAVLKALGQALPHNSVAAGYDSTTSMCLSHLSDGRYQVFIELRDGGYGASCQGDGCDAVAGPLSNCTNVPVEQLDADFDYFRVERYALRPGSGGAGKFRGGVGSSRSYRILADDVRLTIYADRFRVPAAGLAGGEAGATGGCEVYRGNDVFRIRSKDDFALQRGDIVVVNTGGGGGYGRPAERDPLLIEVDRTRGFFAAG